MEKIEFQQKQLEKKENLEYLFKLEEENEQLRKKQREMGEQNFELSWKLQEFEKKFPRRRSNVSIGLHFSLDQHHSARPSKEVLP